MEDKGKEGKNLISERQIVIFKLGDEEFGVDISGVREIIRVGDVTKVPNTEDYILGIMNLRGGIIVVADLGKKLNLAAKEKSKNTRIIVIEIENSTIGMVVDSCNEVLRLAEEKIESAPDIIKHRIHEDYLEGVGVLDKRLIILLSLKNVMGAEGIKHIEHVKKSAEKMPVHG